MEIAARYLATRPRTRWEVVRRLRHAERRNPVIVAGPIAWRRWATLTTMPSYVGGAINAIGMRRGGGGFVEAELRQRGVRRETIETFRGAWKPPERAAGDEALPANDQERAAAAIERHLRGQPVPEDSQALQRLGMFLVRRGFDPETARTAIRTAQRARRGRLTLMGVARYGGGHG